MITERQGAEDGLTLVELLITIFISTLFLSLLAALFVNGLNAQAQATDRDLATGKAGVMSNSVLTSIRNASSFTVTDAGRGLIATVAVGASGWECRGWFLESDGEVRHAASASALSTASAAGWTALSTGVTGTLTGGAAFAQTGRELTMGLRVALGEAHVPVTNGVTAQAVAEDGGPGLLVTIAERLRAHRDEQGSALVSVLVIMLVLSIGGLALAAIVTNTTSTLVDSRTTVQSRAAADAGLAEAIGQGRRVGGVCTIGLTSTSAPRYTVSSSCSGGRVTVTSTGFGEDGGTTVTTAVYQVASAYQGLDGALVSASGSLNISSIDVQSASNEGDIILNTGNFDCNNGTEVDGDLIVRNGSVTVSNACVIRGDLMASGNILINNNAVGVGGNVVTLGSFGLTTGATVGGDVLARGTATVNSGGKINGSVTAVGNVSIDGSATRIGGSVVTGGAVSLNSATIVGSLSTSSTADASFYRGSIGSVRVAGRFNSMHETSVLGSVESTRAGHSNSIAPGTSIGGGLRVAGTISTWGSGPTAVGGITQNATGLVVPIAPTVPTPYELTTSAFLWTDLPYTDTAWTGAGYTVLPIPGCDFQNVAANVAAVNARTAPTVYDGRSCTDPIKMYNVTFNLKTDIAFIVAKANAQRLTINSADSQPHQFHFLTPDNTANQSPTCSSGYGQIVLGDVAMAPLITGAAYSPCTISIGQSSGGSRWNGQIYAGTVQWGGNSTPRMILDYKEVDLPGFDPSAGGGGGGGVTTTLGSLVSQRDVP